MIRFTFFTHPDTCTTPLVFTRDHLKPRGERREMCCNHKIGDTLMAVAF